MHPCVCVHMCIICVSVCVRMMCMYRYMHSYTSPTDQVPGYPWHWVLAAVRPDRSDGGRQDHRVRGLRTAH